MQVSFLQIAARSVLPNYTRAFIKLPLFREAPQTTRAAGSYGKTCTAAEGGFQPLQSARRAAETPPVDPQLRWTHKQIGPTTGPDPQADRTHNRTGSKVDQTHNFGQTHNSAGPTIGPGPQLNRTNKWGRPTTVLDPKSIGSTSESDPQLRPDPQ